MTKKARFSDYCREVGVNHHVVSYNDLMPEIKKDTQGKEIPYKPPKVDLRGKDIYRLLYPYTRVRFVEQLKAVIPLAIYLILFQVIILRQGITDSGLITGGLFAVILGLMLFMEGLKLGLMPFGESIGNILPTKSPLPVVLTITFLLGVGVTFAEPAIGALQAAGKIVNVNKAPYLYTMLNDWSMALVLVVGGGVGIAAIIGTLRFIYGWSLKPLIYASLIPTLGITVYIAFNPQLAKILGLAWDCGAVTTGPVTVPLVLSLGIGVAASAGKGNDTLSGFGVVTLASVFPIVAVMILSLFIYNSTTAEQIIAAANQAQANASNVIPWHSQSPWQEAILGVRAIVPLVLFLLLVMVVVLREKVRNAGIVAYGIILAVLGMVIFNLGLTYGLAKLGNQSGSLVPAAFTTLSAVEASPIYGISLGKAIAIAFACFLGFGATLAEPALNALGTTVENLTSGAFKKSLLMYSVSIGVSIGLGLGVCKIMWDFPLIYLLLPGYIIALIMTALSTEEFVNVAWDSAGVTTGPVTVPLVLAMGLGFGKAVGVTEGFGILSMASICPILAVMTCGLFLQYKRGRAASENNNSNDSSPVKDKVEVT